MDILKILIMSSITAGLIWQIIYLQRHNVFNNQILGVISRLFFTITVFILTIYYSIVILYPEAEQPISAALFYSAHLFCIALYASGSYISKFQAAGELLAELNINDDPNIEACIDRYKEDAAKYPSATLTFLKISTFILSILYIIPYIVVFNATTAEVANKNNILFEKSEQKNNNVSNNLDIDGQEKEELPIKDAETVKPFVDNAQRASMLNANLLADRRFFYISISCIFLMVFMIVLVHGDYSSNSSAFGYIDAHYAEFIADRAKKMLNSKDLNKYDMHIGDGSITQALVFLGVHLFALTLSVHIFIEF